MNQTGGRGLFTSWVDEEDPCRPSLRGRKKPRSSGSKPDPRSRVGEEKCPRPNYNITKNGEGGSRQGESLGGEPGSMTDPGS